MDEVIDYISANYIWFLVGAGVLLMIIIGFIADKTGFVSKKSDKSKEPKPSAEPTEPNEEELKAALKNKTLTDTIYENSGLTPKKSDENQGEASKTQIVETTNSSADNPKIKPDDNNKQPQNEDLNAPLPQVKKDIVLNKEEEKTTEDNEENTLESLTIKNLDIQDDSERQESVTSTESTKNTSVSTPVNYFDSLNDMYKESTTPLKKDVPNEVIDQIKKQMDEPVQKKEEKTDSFTVPEIAVVPEIITDKIPESDNSTTNVSEEEDIWKF